jgi:heat shock protein HslJ
MKKLSLSLLLVGLLLVACSGQPSLTGATWKLVSYGPPGDDLAAMADVPTSLVFGTDGKVNGNMGCNSFGGDYKSSGGKITFGPIMSTMMACDQPIMNQEQGVLGILMGTVDYRVADGRLTLTNADGTVATFDQ